VSDALISVIRFYQRIAPAAVRGTCRFTPTCSEYAIRSIEKYGPFRGGWRAARRILRCRAPNGGIDEP
jgi:uncharacterized protein